MASLGLERDVVDASARARTAAHYREEGIVLPTFAQLADPGLIPEDVTRRLEAVGPDEAHPLNLFRVHWYNAADRRGRVEVPGYISLPQALTGVDAPILVALGNRFPMIGAHKVLAAYGCLVPRVVTGQFDPDAHRAVWPSTGNYCRGGVAISRVTGCRGVAVLPEGMSQERFDWLDAWAGDPGDIIRTPGSESNVKEIYDECARLDADPTSIIFNQFCEFGNYLVHRIATGLALSRVFEDHRDQNPGARLRAFVSATGSGGTIAAGDALKERYGAATVALEALECPTLLYNGFGEHNIQGIGDKHVPYIHNVLNQDFVVAVSEESTDGLGVLFNTEVGRAYLRERRGVEPALIEALGHMGLSSICNVLGAIKTARYLDLGPDDVVVTVATDGFEMYGSERDKAVGRWFGGRFDAIAAGETWGAHLKSAHTDHVLELSHRDKERLFNLGYFTWVEQQGVEVSDFQARRDQAWWDGLLDLVPQWDRMITELNAEAAG